MNKLRFVVAAGIAVALTMIIVPAFAQSGTIVDVGAAFGAWRDLINTVVGTLIDFMVMVALGYFARKTHVEITNSMSDRIQTAAWNAAGLLVAQGVKSTHGVSFDVKNPAVANAIRYVVNAVPEAVKKFNLSDQDIADKIAAKLGQLTHTDVKVNVPSPPGAAR